LTTGSRQNPESTSETRLPAASPAPLVSTRQEQRRISQVDESSTPASAILILANMTDVGGRRSFKVFGQEFIVDARYNVTKELGQGAYGIVCAAQAGHDPKEQVAVKKITNVFSKQILAKRALREIKLLQHFRGHRNVSLPAPPTPFCSARADP
jgi:serine/threonine protein kinase